MKIYHKIVGQGPDLVLLPGWAFHSDVWSSLVKYLENQFTVHLFDFPGFGRMNNIKIPNSLEHCVDILYPELPQSAKYIGWSLGGLLTLLLAMRFPERVESVITIGSTPYFLQQDSWRGVTESYFTEFYAAVESNSAKALQQFILFSLAERGQQKTYFSSLWEIFNRYQPTQQALLVGLQLLQNTDLRANKQTIRCPIQNIVGTKDPLAFINDEYDCPLETAGHFPMLTHSTELYALIQSFYAKYS